MGDITISIEEAEQVAMVVDCYKCYVGNIVSKYTRDLDFVWELLQELKEISHEIEMLVPSQYQKVFSGKKGVALGMAIDFALNNNLLFSQEVRGILRKINR